MYRLKPDADYGRLFRQAAKCGGEVIFETKNGDKINLKSVFSRFVFAVISGNKEDRRDGQLVFADEDFPLLREFLEEV